MKRLLLSLVLAILPVSGFAASAVITTNGTDCSVSTRCLVVSLPQDKGGATLTLSGTWTGTMQFEATGDGGTTWSSVNVLPLNSTTAVTSSTGNGTWQVNMSGFTGIRIRSSASMTGSAVATITPSAASFAQRVTGGSGGIGNANYTGTQNVLAKGDATAHTLIDSQVTDNGTDPVRSPNGFNTTNRGPSQEPGANANPGTTLNKMACINGSQQMTTCGVSTTKGSAGVAIAGAGNSGTPVICTGLCSVIYDNQTTIGDIATYSTTVAGDLHDLGSATCPGTGADCFTIDAANSGAGTAALTEILTPRNFSAATSSLGTKTLRSLMYAFGDAVTGSTLTTSEVGYLTVPFACTISGWHIMADAGTVTVKTWRVNGGTALPTVSNSISTSGVSLSSGTKVDSTTVTDWTSTAIAANDTLGFNLSAVATAKQITFQLDCLQ